MEDLVLEALTEKQAKIEKLFNKLDAQMHPDLPDLAVVYDEAQQLVGKMDSKSLSRMGELADIEKDFRKKLKASCQPELSNKWINAKMDLEEINIQLANYRYHKRL